MKGKIKLMVILLGALLMLQTPFLAKAALTHDWSGAIEIQDTDSTPGQGERQAWYDDAKGAPGQPERELLYLYVDWDDTYIYVRWDVEESIIATRQIYYLLQIANGASSPAPATHSLRFEVDVLGIVIITVRTNLGTTVWTGTPDDWSMTELPYSSPLTGRTACAARFPWSALGGTGIRDVWIIEAQSYSTEPGEGEVMDYIGVGGNPIPWFTDLTMTLLITIVLVAFYVKKRGALPVKLKA